MQIKQESKYYQRQAQKITRQNTIENTLALLESRFQAEDVNALTPSLQKITDLQRLKQLLIGASEARSLEVFTQMLNE